MKGVVFTFALILLIGLSTQSFSANAQTFVMEGAGYGISDKETEFVEIQLYLGPSKRVLQDGHLQISDKVYSIESLNLSFYRSEKIFRINAVAENDSAFTGIGRLILSNQDGSVYLLSGKLDNNGVTEKIILYTILKEGSLPQTQNDITEEDQMEEQGFATVLPDKKDVLLLVKHTDRVEWLNSYKFTARTFDPKENTFSNFDKTSGYLEGVEISADVTDPLGNIVKTFAGKTQKFGYYEGSFLIPDNARVGTWKLNITASGDQFKTTNKEFVFFVDPPRSDGTTSP